MARICGYESPAEFCANVIDSGHDLHVEPLRWAEFDRLLREHGGVVDFESRIRRKDGVTIWISENARAVRDEQGGLRRYESRVMEITGRKMAESGFRHTEERGRLLEVQLIQARQLVAAGRLACGLAHDFNNELSVIMGWSRLLLDRGTLPTAAVASLVHILNAGNRATILTQQLQAFSRQQELGGQAPGADPFSNDIGTGLRQEKPARKLGSTSGEASELPEEGHSPAAGAFFFQKSC